MCLNPYSQADCQGLALVVHNFFKKLMFIISYPIRISIIDNFLISEKGKPTVKLGRKVMGLPIEECQVTSYNRLYSLPSALIEGKRRPMSENPF